MTQSVYFLPDGTAEWELLPWDVKVDDVVGEGAFGEIRCGRWRGSPVAIKTLKSDCMTDAIALKEFNCEMSIWCRLVHPNIVQFLGVGYKAGQPPIMVCELMGGGSLQQKLLELQSWGKKMDFDRAFKIASNVAAALNYMHSRRPCAVIHRDLKPANILLTSNGVAKVADFGLSKMFDITTPREPARGRKRRRSLLAVLSLHPNRGEILRVHREGVLAAVRPRVPHDWRDGRVQVHGSRGFQARVLRLEMRRVLLRHGRVRGVRGIVGVR